MEKRAGEKRGEKRGGKRGEKRREKGSGGSREMGEGMGRKGEGKRRGEET